MCSVERRKEIESGKSCCKGVSLATTRAPVHGRRMRLVEEGMRLPSPAHSSESVPTVHSGRRSAFHPRSTQSKLTAYYFGHCSFSHRVPVCVSSEWSLSALSFATDRAGCRHLTGASNVPTMLRAWPVWTDEFAVLISPIVDARTSSLAGPVPSTADIVTRADEAI